MAKILKIAGWTATATLGLGVITYLVLIAINWRDCPPSPAAVRLAEVHRARPAVADEENAFVYMTKFNAHPGGDTPSRAPVVQEFLGACKPDETRCAQAFESADGAFERWMADESDLLERYRSLIAHRGWREPVFDIDTVLPPFAQIIAGQKLYLLNTRALARKGDSAGVRTLLQDDLKFWRNVQQSSDNLISKMIAVRAIVNHFELGNLVLRGLPPAAQADAIPTEWRREFSDEERSMLRCMTGEWMFASGMLLDARSFDGMKSAFFLRPLYRAQDSINIYAEHYLRTAQILDAPLPRYASAVDQVAELSKPKPTVFSAYNPVGYLLLNPGVADFSSYGRRVADLEGVRRAALAAAMLRGTGIQASEVAAALAASTLRNPYNGRPFEWNEQDRAVMFRGLEPGKRGEHLLYY